MKRLAISFVLLVAACGGKAPAPATPASVAPEAADDGNEFETVVFQVDNGDAGCTVMFGEGDDEDRMPALPEICATYADLSDVPALLRTEVRDLPAGECAGDPACTLTEAGPVIVELEPHE